MSLNKINSFPLNKKSSILSGLSGLSGLVPNYENTQLIYLLPGSLLTQSFFVVQLLPIYCRSRPPPRSAVWHHSLILRILALLWPPPLASPLCLHPVCMFRLSCFLLTTSSQSGGSSRRMPSFGGLTLYLRRRSGIMFCTRCPLTSSMTSATS